MPCDIALDGDIVLAPQDQHHPGRLRTGDVLDQKLLDGRAAACKGRARRHDDGVLSVEGRDCIRVAGVVGLDPRFGARADPRRIVRRHGDRRGHRQPEHGCCKKHDSLDVIHPNLLTTELSRRSRLLSVGSQSTRGYDPPSDGIARHRGLQKIRRA